ncbi:MAG: zinc-ribbon domain-containing protein [Candidatus Bathyarchaeia archaeon]
MSTSSCSKCAKQVPIDAVFCPHCGVFFAQPQRFCLNTRLKLVLMAGYHGFFVSLLWFKISNSPLFTWALLAVLL